MLSEIVVGRTTAPGSTLTQLTACTGNSYTVRDFKSGKARIVDLWLKSQNSAGGTFRVRTTKTEPIQGMRPTAIQNTPLPLIPTWQGQPMYANDTIYAEVAGSSTAGDIEIGGMIIAYDTLTGVTQAPQFNLADLQAIRRANPSLIVETLTLTLSLGTSGDYTGEAALSTSTNQLFNNTRYALLGYSLDATCGAVRLRSNTDFGPLGIGGPGTTRVDITKDYFVNLNVQYGVPIPTFNTINLPNILVDGVQDEIGTDVTVVFYVVNLDQPKA